MITRIELHNFQSHKDTVIDFTSGVNVITGESDNGKSAVIRAVRWVVENQPSGTDKVNSSWNDSFKNPLSVRIYTEDGWVERIRTKNRNGYTVCKGDGKPVDLSAVGRNVPPEVINFFNLSDVNFQWQLDPPYLLSKTSGEASRYLNEIVHLDSIDSLMSIADSDKRQVSSEQKTVEDDIKAYTEQLESLNWVDDADFLYQRVKKLDEKCSEAEAQCSELNDSISRYNNLKSGLVDLDEVNKIVAEIDSIEIVDCFEFQRSISQYKELKDNYVDLDEVNRIVTEIDSIIVTDEEMEFNKMTVKYKELQKEVDELDGEIKSLVESLPEVCPYCGSRLEKGRLECL